MKRPTSRREIILALAPPVIFLIAVLLGGGELSVAGSATAAPWLRVVLILSLVLASLHRPVGGSTLGLGAVALPSALVLIGPSAVGWFAFLGYILGHGLRRLLERLAPPSQPLSGDLLQIVASAGRAGLAALASFAAAVVAMRFGSSLLQALSIAGVIFVLIGLIATWLDGYFRPTRRLELLRLARPLALDALGWSFGVVVAAVGLETTWSFAAAVLTGVVCLCLEATRLALRGGRTEQRVFDLERVSQAGQRISSLGYGLVEIAEQIRRECREVVPFHYFQFELFDEGGGRRSWWAGPRGVLQAGYPEPGSAPPARIGVHRRNPWTLLERELSFENRRLAHLRLWIDGRLLDPADEELLDALLPQMSASIQRSLLDREAKEDPLTGLLVRRVLERKLTEAYVEACDLGRPMSLIICDIDHFKNINDTWGHDFGDQALIAFAQTLDRVRRQQDLCCRYGGEEFTILLESASGADSLLIAERLRRAIEEIRLTPEDEETQIQMTASFGIASFPEIFVEEPKELLAFADKALYQAKRRGRNRCFVNLGRGRYQGVSGEIFGAPDEEPQGPVEAPRLFS